MRLLHIVSTLALVVVSIFAQSNQQPNDATIPLVTPGLATLDSLFRQNVTSKQDPFELIARVAAKGDTVVPPLMQLLKCQDSILSHGFVQSGSPARSIAILTILTLESIGTPTSYSSLLLIGGSFSDSEVKGVALNSLATSWYFRVISDTNTPDKELVHLLLHSVDDSTFVPYLFKSIAQVTRDGVKNWLGLDLGDYDPTNATAMVGEDSSSVPIVEYREYMWHKMESNLVWNRNTSHFEVQQ